LPLTGHAVELELDDFEFSPYTNMNPDTTPTVVTFPTTANQADPEPSTSLTGEGLAMFTRLGNAGFEVRTLAQVVADLGGRPADWSQPVYLSMQVKARWQASAAPIGSFSGGGRHTRVRLRRWRRAGHGDGGHFCSCRQ